jgi:hypothetical protein
MRTPMDKPVLTDRAHSPTDKVVFSHLGKNKELWAAAFDCISKDYPDLTEYRQADRSNTIRGTTIVWGKRRDIKDFRILIAVKRSIK